MFFWLLLGAVVFAVAVPFHLVVVVALSFDFAVFTGGFDDGELVFFDGDDLALDLVIIGRG